MRVLAFKFTYSAILRAHHIQTAIGTAVLQVLAPTLPGAMLRSFE